MTHAAINLNEVVFVRLSETGKRALDKHYADIRLRIPSLHDYHPPASDADGLHKFQLHDLMRIFGPECSVGRWHPFEGGNIFFTLEAAREATP